MKTFLVFAALFLISIQAVYSQKILKGRERVPLEVPWAETQVGAFEKGIPSVNLAQPAFPVFKVNQNSAAQPQNEPTVRINRKNRNNIVAAYRDFQAGSNPPIRNISIAASTDGGVTWTEQLTHFMDYDRYSDPALGVDTAGNFYLVTLDYRDAQSSSNNSLTVWKSTDGGLSWPQAVSAVPQNANTFHDREILAVDDGRNSPFSGNVYVSWTEFANTTDIYCVMSFDGGQNWYGPLMVSDNSNVQMSMPVTGPHGELYVVWENFGSTNTIYFDKCDVPSDMTFGADVPVSDGGHAPADFMDLHGGIQTAGYPVAAVDKSDGPGAGTIYVVWQAWTYGDADLFISSSTDGGSTWGSATRVNDDTLGNGRDQFHHWVTVDDSGWVNVVFLDRRNDPANLLCDAYLAQSRDGGQTFRNYRLSAQNFDPRTNYNSAVRFGDYTGIDAALGKIVPIWTDSHLGTQDIFIASIEPVQAGAIGGFVFNDQDGNGHFDAGETPLAGIPVILSQTAGPDTLLTDSAGHYAFTGLEEGVYTVGIVLPAGIDITSPAPPGTYAYTFAAPQRIDTANFGLHYRAIASNGWNLVSVCRRAADMRAVAAFPFAISPAFTFQSGYVTRETLALAAGYWLKFTGGQNLQVNGDSVTIETVYVHKGWNIIGSISSPVHVSSILLTSNPDTLIASDFFGYSFGYFPATTIEPGRGYWVKCTTDGYFLIVAAGHAAPAAAHRAIPTPEGTNGIVATSDEGAQAQITYRLAKEAFVQVQVYDVFGRTVTSFVNALQLPGEYHVNLGGGTVAPGVYYYTVRANEFTTGRRKIIVK